MLTGHVLLLVRPCSRRFGLVLRYVAGKVYGAFSFIFPDGRAVFYGIPALAFYSVFSIIRVILFRRIRPSAFRSVGAVLCRLVRAIFLRLVGAVLFGLVRAAPLGLIGAVLFRSRRIVPAVVCGLAVFCFRFCFFFNSDRVFAAFFFISCGFSFFCFFPGFLACQGVPIVKVFCCGCVLTLVFFSDRPAIFRIFLEDLFAAVFLGSLVFFRDGFRTAVFFQDAVIRSFCSNAVPVAFVRLVIVRTVCLIIVRYGGAGYLIDPVRLDEVLYPAFYVLHGYKPSDRHEPP